MGVHIQINKSAIKQKVVSAWQSGLHPLSEQVLKDCNAYCKLDQGALMASSQTHSELSKGRLIWATPYAARQHWEIRTASTDANPNASWRWTLVAKSTHVKAWTALAQRLLKENL